MEKQFKYYYNNLFTKNSLDEAIKDYKSKVKENERKDMKFVYLFQEKDLLKNDIDDEVKYVYNHLKWKINNENIVISFNHNQENNFNNNAACKNLYDLTLKYPYISMGIESGDITWKVEDILKSNKKLDDISKNIKDRELSPVEKLLMAYLKVSKLPYLKEGKDENPFLSREIYSILNSDKIVCVGYVEYLKELLLRIDSKGSNIKLFEDVFKDENVYHETAIIYVNDEKYGLNGYYYFDPTLDSKSGGVWGSYSEISKGLGTILPELKYFYEYQDSIIAFLCPLQLLKYKNDLSIDDRYPLKKEDVELMRNLWSPNKYYNIEIHHSSSIVYGNAELNGDLLNHIYNTSKIYKNCEKTKNLDFSQFKQLMKSDSKTAFDILSSSSQPVSLEKLVLILLNVYKSEGQSEDTILYNLRKTLMYNKKVYPNYYKINDISPFSSKQISEFSQDFPELDIRTPSEKERDDFYNQHQMKNKGLGATESNQNNEISKLKNENTGKQKYTAQISNTFSPDNFNYTNLFNYENESKEQEDQNNNANKKNDFDKFTNKKSDDKKSANKNNKKSKKNDFSKFINKKSEDQKTEDKKSDEKDDSLFVSLFDVGQENER